LLVMRRRNVAKVPVSPVLTADAGGAVETMLYLAKPCTGYRLNNLSRTAAHVPCNDAPARLHRNVTQLVKACFYPEFTVCRDSFREVAKDGSCRRQELARVRQRVSGTHCVDCPHWVALTPAGHGELLQREWRSEPGILEDNCGVFLPEDFRELRRWLHARARA
jgi:hypothetical protein